MGRIISFVSGKGGAGKSVIIANLGATMAKNGKRVLLIDCDIFTRGLTFYMMGDNLTESGILDFIKGNVRSWELRSQIVRSVKEYKSLDLLSASGRSTYYSSRDIDDRKFLLGSNQLARIYSELKDLFISLRSEYDYILIDTRSGIDPISLLPALVADEYVLIMEEDKTSWRISDLMVIEIKSLAEKFNRNGLNPELRLKGFIINKITEAIPDDFIEDYLEKRVIEGRCLLQISLEREVPMAFKVDKLVIKRFSNSEFSKKLEDLLNIFEGYQPVKNKDRKPLEILLEFYGKTETSLLIISLMLYFIGMLLFTTNNSLYYPFVVFGITLLGLGAFVNLINVSRRLLKKRRLRHKKRA